MSTTVRPARPEEAAAVAAVHEAAWNASAGAIVGRELEELAPFESRVEQIRAGLEDPPADACLLVAERAGELIGMAVCRGDELRDLYVAPASWATGAADALLDESLAFLRSAGVRRAILWVGEANLRARRFYEKHGWRPDGSTRESPLGPGELRYSREIDEP